MTAQTLPIRGKKQQIEIRKWTGLVTVDATVYSTDSELEPVLAIHRSLLGRSWAITHIATGRQITEEPRKREAQDLAIRLLVLDWSQRMTVKRCHQMRPDVQRIVLHEKTKS